MYSDPSMEESEEEDDGRSSTSSLSTDSAFCGPYPLSRYTLFLHYYSKLQQDPEDADGSALLLLNTGRKQAGIVWALEDVNYDEEEDPSIIDVDMVDETGHEDGVQRAEGPWGNEGTVLGDTAAHYDQEHMEVDMEVESGTISTEEVDHLKSLSDFMEVVSPATPATQTTTPDLSQRGKSPSPAHGAQSLLSPSCPVPIAVPIECHSFTGSELSSCFTEPIGESTPLEEVESMERAESTKEDTNTPSRTAEVSCPVPGPTSIYDLEAIMTPATGVETAHLREKLLQWKQVEWLQRGAGSGRPTRRKDSRSERLKEGIARELATVDAQLVRYVLVHATSSTL